jgi:TetR/AcrR family transcriptional regulator
MMILSDCHGLRIIPESNTPNDKNISKRRAMSSTEEKIIKAAIEEFSLHGFAGARIDRIAKNAKVNKAMIYYHYKNKEKLYEAILSVPAGDIYNFVKDLLPDEMGGIDQLFSILSEYMEYINKVDPALIRIIIGEIASGGKYFRKIVFPKLISPLTSIMAGVLIDQIQNKTIRQVNPHYTLFQIIGSVVFFNMIKIALKGTDLHAKIFSGNYLKEYKENLIGILKYGLILKEGNE